MVCYLLIGCWWVDLSNIDGGTCQFLTLLSFIHWWHVSKVCYPRQYYSLRYLSYLHCCLTDQELRNVIDKLAQFVARNGPEFEKMTMEKQKDNPKFSFLFGGEFFGYYKYKLAIEQQQRK